MSTVIFEIPKAFFSKSYCPKNGANNLSYILLHQLIRVHQSNTIILLTDANAEDFEQFKFENKHLKKLVYATYETIENCLFDYQDIQYCFISDLNITAFLKFRNYFQLRIPVVGLIHALGTREQIDKLQEVANFISNIDCLICPTQSTQKTVHNLANKMNIELLKQVTKVINHGIDCDHFAPSKQKNDIRKALDIAEDKVVILSLSRINPYTKMDIIPMLDNLKEIVKENTTVLLLVVGSVQVQDYFKQVQDYVKKLNLEQSVKFIKEPEPPFNKYFQLADIFISPIDNSIETFGLSVVEAMATELPVVISKLGPYNELLEDPNEGYLIPAFMFKGEKSHLSKEFHTSDLIKFGDAFSQSIALDNNAFRERLLDLIKSPEKRTEIGVNARKRVLGAYNLPLMVKNYITTLEALAKEAKTKQIEFAKNTILDLDDIYLHFSDNILDSDVKLKVSERGLKVLLEEESLLMFMRHKMQYPFLPQIVNYLHSNEASVKEISKALDVKTADLSGDIMYLLKHDLVVISNT